MMRRALFILALLLALPAQAATKLQEIEAAPGYMVWLAEDHTLPLFTLQITFEQAGYAYDPAGKQGLASFVSQLLDEGSGEMDALAFNRAVEASAIRYSVSTEADTTTLTVQALSEFKGKALELALQSLTRPRFDPDAVERIRADISSYLRRSEKEPSYLASRAWKQAAFAGHPYANLRRGTAQSVASITAEDLRGYASAHFFAGKAPLITVVGDVTPDEIKHWKLPAIAERALPAAPDDIAPATADAPIRIPVSVPQSQVTASLPGVNHQHADYYAQQVLAYILGGNSITSRLGTDIRDARGLAYFVGGGTEEMDHTSFLIFSFSTRAEQLDEALGRFRAILRDTAEKGVTEEELRDAKSYLTGSFPLQIDTQASLAGTLTSMRHFGLGKDYLERRNALIEQVTLPQVNQLAARLLAPPPLVAIAGPSPTSSTEK